MVCEISQTVKIEAWGCNSDQMSKDTVDRSMQIPCRKVMIGSRCIGIPRFLYDVMHDENCMSPAPEISKSAQNFYPRSSNRHLEGSKNIPNLGSSAGSVICPHIKVTARFYSGRWLYFVRTVYHQPAQKLKNIPDHDPQQQ